MILVLLGTQDKPFSRLLEAIQKQINLGVIKERVIVQAGYTKFNSSDMEIFSLIPNIDLCALIKKSDLIITHGGVASIMEGIQNGKKIIAAGRLKKYGEHVNDHQLQIIQNFSQEGYIKKLEDFDLLGDVIKEMKSFSPKKFLSNNKKFLKELEKEINK